MISSAEEIVCDYNPVSGKMPKWTFYGRPCLVTKLILCGGNPKAGPIALIAIPLNFPREIRVDVDDEGNYPGLEYEDSK